MRFFASFTDRLRSDKAKQEIRAQILDTLARDALAPKVEEFLTQIQAACGAAINRMYETSEVISAAGAAALKQEAERLRAQTEAQLRTFLRSSDGRNLFIELLIEALTRTELAPFVKDAQDRLKEVAADEIAALRAHAESGLQSSSNAHRAALQREVEKLDQRAAAMALNLGNRVFEKAEQKLRQLHEAFIASAAEDARQRINAFMQSSLPDALRDVVEHHVAGGPRFVKPHSNRWIAAELRITVREVKRRRRMGLI